MEEGISRKSIEISVIYDDHLTDVYDYTVDIFGEIQAERYIQKIEKIIETLPYGYLFYPECRHIPTQSRMYRNIILDAHLIIYRITGERIEVLDIVHSASSTGKIRGVCKIKL